MCELLQIKYSPPPKKTLAKQLSIFSCNLVSLLQRFYHIFGESRLIIQMSPSHKQRVSPATKVAVKRVTSGLLTQIHRRYDETAAVNCEDYTKISTAVLWKYLCFSGIILFAKVHMFLYTNLTIS